MSNDWLEKLAKGIEKNFKNPSQYKCVYEKENNKELHDLDQIRAPFEIVTDKIIELVKEVRSKKVDSIPQTNVTK